MLEYRPAAQRGHVSHGWLNSHHSFSFASYYNPARMGVSDLRVLNDDIIAPGGGFPMHGHQDMEILTYVLGGALEHSDSMGNRDVVRPGEIQLMRAGIGVHHSEANASATEPVHLLQIWIEPAHSGATPGYAQTTLDADALREGFVEIAGQAHAVQIDQDVRMLAAWPQAGSNHATGLDTTRQYYLHLATGSVEANGQALEAGDALVLRTEAVLQITAQADSQVLLFDLRPSEAQQ